ncbi:MAG: cytochrome c biogenesis protein CcsA [Oligoflexia bacterium]|nr:cytochrome c biogenesis protein CcsA [Oligoflexia bacterium]
MKQLQMLLLILLILFPTYGQALEFCQNPALEKLPMLTAGRVVPLFVHAQEMVKGFLIEKKGDNALTATALYCYLSLGQKEMVSERFALVLGAKVKHPQLKDFFHLDKNDNKVSIEILASKKEELWQRYQMEVNAGRDREGVGLALGEVLLVYNNFVMVTEGRDWNYLERSGKWAKVLALYQELSANANEEEFSRIVLKSNAYLSASEVQSLQLVTLYEKSRPFATAIILCLLGFFCALLAIKRSSFDLVAQIVLWITLIVEVYGIVLRMMISGRAPITNMYETVLIAGWGALLLAALIVYFGKDKDKRLLPLGFVCNLAALFMMNFSTTMLDASIKPLVPVLRDNFWLSTHVTSVVLSYAAFTLGSLVANVVVIAYIFSTRFYKQVQEWNQIIRITMQVGVVFLTIGILLGGIWADYSWGRFWGWDPKETWSLITLIAYLVVLHGWHVGWFREILFSFVAIIGLMLVLMTWFGVNYILSVGLHSYGVSAGGTIFLLSIFIVELMILFLGVIRYRISYAKAKAKVEER